MCGVFVVSLPFRVHFLVGCMILFFFFKQTTAYERRISDWSSDVCSSDLVGRHLRLRHYVARVVQVGAMPVIGVARADPGQVRSEERRVGKEGVSTCRSRWSPYHYKKKRRNRKNALT